MARVQVIGGGLAGCEAAWQLAERGHDVELVEMRPVRSTPAHQTDNLAELVCTNSFKSEDLANAHGLLKAEMRDLGSLLLRVADEARVPGGTALVVDRHVFSARMTEWVTGHRRVRLVRAEATSLPEGPAIVATGPLTSPALAADIARVLGGDEGLAFYDSIAPIVEGDSIDRSIAFGMSRWGKGGGDDYLNCPMSREEYYRFLAELRAADVYAGHEWEGLPFGASEGAGAGQGSTLVGDGGTAGLRDSGDGDGETARGRDGNGGHGDAATRRHGVTADARGSDTPGVGDAAAPTLRRAEADGLRDPAVRGQDASAVLDPGVPYFEGCLPVEVMAARGDDTLRFGPMRPIGLRDPRTGRRPWAVVQLRREDAAGQMWNLVGFQTRLRTGEQRRVFRLVPGLERAEFLRFGSIHRNTYLNFPARLQRHGAPTMRPAMIFAGQLTGVEGYTESAASGILAGVNLDRPNVVGDYQLSNASFKRWFNPLAFQANPLGTFGNAGHNIMLGPKTVNVDMGVVRQFTLREPLKLEFRGEAFNIINHANMDMSTTGSLHNRLSDPIFGSITGAADPRILQFALKLHF